MCTQGVVHQAQNSIDCCHSKPTVPKCSRGDTPYLPNMYNVHCTPFILQAQISIDCCNSTPNILNFYKYIPIAPIRLHDTLTRIKLWGRKVKQKKGRVGGEKLRHSRIYTTEYIYQEKQCLFMVGQGDSFGKLRYHTCKQIWCSEFPRVALIEGFYCYCITINYMTLKRKILNVNHGSPYKPNIKLFKRYFVSWL